VLGYALIIVGQILVGIIAAGVVYLVFRYLNRGSDAMIPNLLVNNGDTKTAPFRDATGAHAGALLGDVRHDPFQSGGMETPSHDRVEAGAIHKANKGVLFIDEINTLDIRSQQHLMTAIQEGEFSITGQSERSSGAMVQTEPVPTDFVMIAAGNLDAMENMHPALRSRIKGYGYEVYMEDTIEDTPEMRRKYVRFIAQEVAKDGRLPEFSADAIEEVILEAKRRSGRKGHLTLLFRNLGGLVRVAGDIARGEDAELTTREHVLCCRRRDARAPSNSSSRTTSSSAGRDYELQVSDGYVVGPCQRPRRDGRGLRDHAPGDGRGRALAGARRGHRHGSAEGDGPRVGVERLRHHQEVLRREHLGDGHSHPVRAGGSAGRRRRLRVHHGRDRRHLCAGERGRRPEPRDDGIAVGVRGDVLPVGGVTHKIEGAAKAGCTRVIIPQANEQDVMIEDEYKDMIEVIPGLAHQRGPRHRPGGRSREGLARLPAQVDHRLGAEGGRRLRSLQPEPAVRPPAPTFLIRRSQRRTMSGKPTVGEYMTRDVSRP